MSRARFVTMLDCEFCLCRDSELGPCLLLTEEVEWQAIRSIRFKPRWERSEFWRAIFEDETYASLKKNILAKTDWRENYLPVRYGCVSKICTKGGMQVSGSCHTRHDLCSALKLPRSFMSAKSLSLCSEESSFRDCFRGKVAII